MNKKGFAVSGILYTILLIFLALIYMLLMNFKNKKNLLDQLKSEVINGDKCQSGIVYTFDYTGDVQEFVAPCDGEYKLEVWGAQGGRGYYSDTCYIDDAGYGGYSVGTVNLDVDEKIYVVVGQKPDSLTGGYNGGGNGYSTDNGSELERSSGGGGATHIAMDSGVLSSLSSHATDGRILIVAGGGGGSGTYRRPNGTCGYFGAGGFGGGIAGATGTRLDDSTTSYAGSGGTQSIYGYCISASSYGHGSFGQGGNYYHTCCGGSGGGGGYYGGGGSNRPEWGAGGGSGYIASSNLSNKSMYCYGCSESNDPETYTISTTGSSSERDTTNCSSGYSSNPVSKCAKAGNGYAKITYLGVPGPTKVAAQTGETHKGIVYLDPTDLNKTCNIGNSISTPGTKTGCMKWYIFNDSGDNYTMILDHNTTATVEYETSRTYKEYSQTSIKTQVDTDATGWDSGLNPRLITANEIATITNTSTFAGDSSTWFYFDGTGTNKHTRVSSVQGASPYAWLFDYTKGCTGYGCDINDSSTSGYWTSSPVTDYSYRAWTVYKDGTLINSDVYEPNTFGIRPVITVSKSLIR